MQHTRQIIHLDMDAFYASVEQHDDPALKGKPVIVGGTSSRGVVSAASYEAREFGVHSAMPIVTARRLCPHGVFLPTRMRRYQEISRKIMEIFHTYTPLVEPLSLDEAFLDVTASVTLFGSAEKIAQAIKDRVFQKTGLTVSAGVAVTKIVAKIASDLDKPDGLTVVPAGKERAFLERLAIEKLWGVGQSTRKTLALLRVKTIGDLCRLPPAILESKFGKLGTQMHLAAVGIDDREVIPERKTKSVGNEETFDSDLSEMNSLYRELTALAIKVGRRLRRHALKGKTITLKIKYHDFRQITRSTTLDRATDDSRTINHSCRNLLEKTEAGEKALRLLGISVSKLTGPESKKQLTLLGGESVEERRRQLNQALDTIHDRFGSDGISPGTLARKRK